MTKQTTIVVIGALRVNFSFSCAVALRGLSTVTSRFTGSFIRSNYENTPIQIHRNHRRSNKEQRTSSKRILTELLQLKVH